MKERALKKEALEINELKKELILKLVDENKTLLIFHKLFLLFQESQYSSTLKEEHT
jgi:hypothetical protein